MAKITLNDLQSMNDLTELNDNFTQIEDEFQSRVLYRDNPTGEPNQMEQDLDMNSYRILNLPKPANNSEAARLLDVQNALAGGDANLITYNDENVQTALDKRTIYVGSVAEGISGLPLVDGQSYEILGFDDSNGIGAQSLIADATALKSQHGISGWSPTVPPVSAQSGATRAERVANYLNGVGETDPTGTGLLERKNKKIYNICEYGAVPGSSEPVDASLTATSEACVEGGIITAEPGKYTINQATTRIGRFPDGSDGKQTTVDFSGVTLISAIDQATRFLVTGKTKFFGAVMDKVHVFLEGLADESEVSGCEFLNQNNHFIRTEVARAAITKNIFKSSGSAAAFFNCVSVSDSAVGTRIYGNDFNYTAGGAMNLDATTGEITEDTLIYGNRFFCNGLKEPSSAIKLEATTRAIISGNMFDGNNRAGSYTIFYVGAVADEVEPGRYRRLIVTNNTVTGYDQFIFSSRSSSTYTGGPLFTNDTVISGNTIDNCGKGIRRTQAGNTIVSGNIFRNNDYDIDLSEAAQPNGDVTIEGNTFENSLNASIYTGNKTDNKTVGTGELRIRNNIFKGWNAGAGLNREEICAIIQVRNEFSSSGTAGLRPDVNIENNVFVALTGNEQHAIYISTAAQLRIKNNSLADEGSLSQPVLLHENDTGVFYITSPIEYEGNNWQVVSAPPTTGKHFEGAVYRNVNPAPGGYYAWVNCAEGDFDDGGITNPNFKGFGLIEA